MHSQEKKSNLSKWKFDGETLALDGNPIWFYRSEAGGWMAGMGGTDGKVTGWSNDKLQYKLTLNIVI